MAYTTEQIKGLITSAASRYSINPQIAIRQAQQESGFNPNAVSSAGAQGLFQFMPATWAMYGSGSPFDPVAACEAWGKYMSHLLAIFGGDYRLALAGYHSGEGSARAALNNCKGNPRTCDYVSRIMGNAGSTGATPNEGLSLSPLAIGAIGLLVFLALR